MKARNILTAALLATATTAMANVPVSSPALSMVEGMMNVDMDFNPADFDVKTCELVVITPYLVNEADTLQLDRVGIYGRRRYIQAQRGYYPSFQNPPVMLKADDKETVAYHYNRQVEYKEWFDGATLGVNVKRYCCSMALVSEGDGAENISIWHQPRLNTADCFVYVEPVVKGGPKEFTIEGSANVEFQVNKTVLLEDFRNNYAEIGKIRASIDSVKGDKDVTINSMTIKGFASPEGPYKNNVRLSQGRTAAVVDYVERLYAFPHGFIATDYDPEDWVGLRRWVESSNLEHKEQILAIIDDTALEPDPRDLKIKKTYPAEYEMLLNTVYPSLRHTDYRISYTVRSYTDPAEILRIMKTRPGNLSLDEFLIASKTLEPGTPEYNEVFEIAVRMFPESEIANLNAANTALMGGDTAKAARYLAKAGDSKEARYTRGVLALMEGDYDTAESVLTEASRAGITQADKLLEQIPALRAVKR